MQTIARLLITAKWFVVLIYYYEVMGEETLRFCFSIYDLDDSGFIGEHELFSVFETLCPARFREEGFQTINMINIWRNIDKNGDGKVSFDEFVQGLIEEPILIKALLQEGPSVEEEKNEE